MSVIENVAYIVRVIIHGCILIYRVFHKDYLLLIDTNTSGKYWLKANIGLFLSKDVLLNNIDIKIIYILSLLWLIDIDSYF